MGGVEEKKKKDSKGRGFLCGRKYRGITINQINSQLVVMGLFVGYRQQKHVNGGIIIPLGIFSELSSPFFSLVVAISQRPFEFLLEARFLHSNGGPILCYFNGGYFESARVTSL